MRVALGLAALLLVAPVAAQEADLFARHPNQVAFTVWGDGATYNAFLVEAAPGDALNATVLLRLRGDNDLPAPEDVLLELSVNGTPIAQRTVTWDAGRTEPMTVHLNGTVPDLPQGEHAIQVDLTTGDWDPDATGDVPRAVPLRIGAAQQAEAPASSPWLWVGPTAFAALIAAPIVVRWRHRQGTATGRRLSTAWETWSARWIHAPEATRRRAGTAMALAAFGVIAAVAMVPAGFALQAASLGDALWLAGLTGSAHLAVAFARWRPRPDALDAKATAMPAARTMLLVFAGALLWQQLAAATTFFRWPALASLQSFVAIGLSIGAIYALIAIGYTMVYGILKFINFAHGEVFTWGAYFAWVFVVMLGWTGIIVALLVSMVLTALLGASMERVAYRPLRGGSRLAPLVTAIALSLLLQSLAQFVFQARKVTFTMPGSRYEGSALQAWFSRDVAMLGTVVDFLAITIFVVSILLLVALHLFVTYSKTGRAMRATADDLDTARTIGIRVDRTITVTFVIGSMLAAVGGVFFGLEFGLQPTMGLFVGIKAFTAAVVGGIGNLYGAFLGGFIIGLAENVGGQFIDSRFQKVITFALLIAFLLWRPQGLFGQESDRR